MLGAALAALVALIAHRLKTLTRSGAVASFVAGSITIAAGWSWGFLLLAFFVSGSILSRLAESKKARLLGPVMEHNYMGEPQKFARIAQALGEDTRGLSVWQAAEKAVEAVLRLTADLNIPSLQTLGFREDEIPMLADIAFKDPQTVGNPRDLTLASYSNIYQRTFDMGKA